MVADYYMQSNEKIHSLEQITSEEKNETISMFIVQNTLRTIW